jgi:thymidine kinase
MANLDIIIGPMFAGKSCELIRRIRLLKVLKKEYIVVKPKIDNRYDNLYDSNVIVSHNFDKEHCIVLEKLANIFENNLININTIFIDEGQFFDDLVNIVRILVENYKINVVVSGLDGDSNRNKFGHILDLIPLSNTCTKINASCIMCLDGTPAPFSFRKTNDNEQILIGAGDSYMSLCRKHYLENSFENSFENSLDS